MAMVCFSISKHGHIFSSFTVKIVPEPADEKYLMMATMEDSTLLLPLVHTDWSEFAKRIALSSVLFITSHDEMQEQVPKDLKAFLCRDDLVNRTDPPVHSTPTNSKTQASRHIKISLLLGPSHQSCPLQNHLTKTLNY